jgi:hypothetical protein
MTINETTSGEPRLDIAYALLDRDHALLRLMNALSIVASGLAADMQIDELAELSKCALHLAARIAKTSKDTSEGLFFRARSAQLLEAVACRLLEVPIDPAIDEGRTP